MGCVVPTPATEPGHDGRQESGKGLIGSAEWSDNLAEVTMPPVPAPARGEVARLRSEPAREAPTSRSSVTRAAWLTLHSCMQVAPVWTATRLVTGIASALQPVVYGKMLGVVLTTVAAGAPVSAPIVLTSIAVMGAAHLALQISRAVDTYAQSEIARRLKRASEDTVSGVLFSRYGDAIKPELAGSISRVRDNIWRMERMPQALFELVGASGTLIVAATTLVTAPPVVGLSIGLSAALPFIAHAMLAREAARQELVVQGARQRSWYKGWFLTAPEPARELITSQSESAMRDLYRRDTTLVEGAERTRDKHRLLFDLSGAPITAGGAMISLGALLGSWASGQLSIGDVAYIFGVAWPIVTGLLVQISQSVGVISQGTVVVADLQDLRMSVGRQQGSEGMMAQQRTRVPAISLEKLSFSYAEGALPVLQDVSLEFPAGSYVGLVGAIGAGKSTLCQLLAGLLPPTSGHIRVDGNVLGEYPALDWLGGIAYCYQDPVVFQSLTLREYLTLGLKEVDEEFIQRVSDQSGLTALVEEFPLGWNTTIGGEFSGGRTLSGGERQLLAFTRALCRRPVVLLVDEPTANLNPQQAERVLQLLAAPAELLGYTPTRVFVSHNIRHLTGTDTIVLVQGGGEGSVLHGNYEALLATSPEFAAMVQAERGMVLPIIRGET